MAGAAWAGTAAAAAAAVLGSRRRSHEASRA